MTHKPMKARDIPNGVGLFVAEFIKIFVLAAVIIVPIRVFLFQPFLVHGASMDPTFASGDYLIINEVGYKTVRVPFDQETPLLTPSKTLQRGDVIVFRFPRNPHEFFIKRVIGLPGERVRIVGDQVTIFNATHPEGEALVEPYIKSQSVASAVVDVTIPDDAYFVMGDNRGGSYDSRDWGPLAQEYVVGKVALRVWPVPHAQTF